MKENMNMIRILILGIILAPVIIYYTYNRIGRFLKYYQKYTKVKVWLWTCIFLLTMMSLTTTVSIIFLFLLIASLLLDGIDWLFVKIMKKKIPKVLEKAYQTGILILILGAIFTGYGYWNTRHIKATTYQLETEKRLPGDSLKLIQISDLHFGATLTVTQLQKELEKINNKKPDFVVLTGDIFDENTTKKEMQEVSKLLGKMKTTYGIYYILGNHDPNYYARNKKYTKEELLKTLEENHIKPLIDEAVLVENEFYIIGRKDISLGTRKDLEELTKKIDFSKYIILLDHQPVELNNAENNQIDLQLSGHTHAGQIWPLGLLMDLAKIYPLSYGKYQSENYTAIVSSGMGEWNYPLRTSKNAEYVEIYIKSNNKEVKDREK